MRGEISGVNINPVPLLKYKGVFLILLFTFFFISFLSLFLSLVRVGKGVAKKEECLPFKSFFVKYTFWMSFIRKLGHARNRLQETLISSFPQLSLACFINVYWAFLYVYKHFYRKTFFCMFLRIIFLQAYFRKSVVVLNKNIRYQIIELNNINYIHVFSTYFNR